MSIEKNSFIFHQRNNTLYWNKASGNTLFPVHCPYSGTNCSTLCPHVVLQDERITFYCGGETLDYEGRWEINPTETQQ